MTVQWWRIAWKQLHAFLRYNSLNNWIMYFKLFIHERKFCGIARLSKLVGYNLACWLLYYNILLFY